MVIRCQVSWVEISRDKRMCCLNFKWNDNLSYKHGSTIQYNDTVTADVICEVMKASSMGWKYLYVAVYVFLDIFHSHISYLCILPVHPQTWGFISSIVREGCQFGILAGECSQQINGNPPSILEVFVGLVFWTWKPCQHWCLRPTKCFVAAVACGTLWGQQPSSKNLVRILRIFWLSFLDSWHTLPSMFCGVFWVHELAVGVLPAVSGSEGVELIRASFHCRNHSIQLENRISFTMFYHWCIFRDGGNTAATEIKNSKDIRWYQKFRE